MPTRLTSPAWRTALALGSEVPAGDFGFRVHGTFASAMNLAVGGGRFLVTVVGPGADAQPQGIRLASRERFDTWPVSPGDRGHCGGGRLLFEGSPGRARLTVDLSRARRMPRRTLPRLRPRGASEREAWQECARFLAARQESEGTALRLRSLFGAPPPPGVLGTRFVDAAAALAEGIRAHDVEAAARSADLLVGLGPGLTPAGDDFLCGMLAALRCTSAEGGVERRFLAGWGSALSDRLERTTAVGATFLHCAIAGCFCGALSDLADRIARSRPGDVSPGLRAAMSRVCAMGHSSGMDTATGFLFGLSIRTDAEMRRYAA